jgi:hypothetical protein
MLPLRIAGVGGGELFADRQSVAIGLQRAGEIALRLQNVADIFVA